MEKTKGNLASKKVFISHSSKDKKIGEYIIDMLVKMGINKRNIFFSSNFDFGPLAGSDSFNEVKTAIQECDLTIFILSANYYSSKFCLNEMGAVWGLEKQCIPLIIDENVNISKEACFYDYRIKSIELYKDISQNKFFLSKLNESLGIEFSDEHINLIENVKIKILKDFSIHSVREFENLEDIKIKEHRKISKLLKTFTREELLDENLEIRLNKIFTSKLLYKALFDSCKSNFCYDLVMIKLSAILIYYLYTNDRRFSYNIAFEIMSYVGFRNRFPSKEILYCGLQNAYPNLNEKELGIKLFENSILNGYAAHSFNPIFKNEIFNNNLGNVDKENPILKNLRDLEKMIYKNKFLNRQENTSFYFTLPSPNAMHYACVGCPERVFGGPLKFLNSNINFDKDVSVYDMLPIRVGEGIKSYYKKVANRNIKIVTRSNIVLKKMKRILKRKMKQLVDNFCCNYNLMLLIPFTNDNISLTVYNDGVDPMRKGSQIFDYILKNANGEREDVSIKNFEDAFNFIRNITPYEIGISDSSRMANLCSTDVISNFEKVICIKIPTFYTILQNYCNHRFHFGKKLVTEMSPYMTDKIGKIQKA